MDETKATVQGLPFSVLMQRNPKYDPVYWARLRALCRGGSELLRNTAIMEDVFPKHRREQTEVYGERCKRAFYMAYAGMVVGDYVTGVLSDPIAVTIGEKDKPKSKVDPDKPSPDKDELPPFYKQFLLDTSERRAISMPISFASLLGECLDSALITGAAWVRVDAPAVLDAEGYRVKFNDRASEEKNGALNIYCIRHEPEEVIDWEVDMRTRALKFCVIFTEESTRESVAGVRNMVKKRWLVHEPTGWQLFELIHKSDQEPKPETVVPMVATGKNKGNVIPVMRLELPKQFWVMDQLEGPSRELLNKWCALSWAEFQVLFSELYEFLEPPTVGAGVKIGTAEERATLALSQARGVGYVQTRGDKDSAEFIGPDTSGFSHALESIRSVRDEIFRITHQLAMAVDMGSAALGRSAESKESDKGSRETVLGALSIPLRSFGIAILNTVATMRDDAAAVGKFELSGMSNFVESNATADIAAASDLQLVRMPSQTFQRIYKSRLARTILKHDADDADLAQIDKELMDNITAESISQEADAMVAPKVSMKPGSGPGSAGAPGAKPPNTQGL